MLRTALCILLASTGCSATLADWPPDTFDADAGMSGVEVDAALLTLDPAPGSYRGACDGSGGVALDLSRFLVLGDEEQQLRVYTRGATSTPLRTSDVSAELGLAVGAEADLEDLAPVGQRIYMISSHGRDRTGDLIPARYRFAAISNDDTLAVIGSSSTLLTDMLDSARWAVPDPQVIAALQSSSQLDRAQVSTLAPDQQGLNIEGLAHAATATHPERLVIGLRNPLGRNGAAIVVTLLDPAAVIAGAPAHFGEAIELPLGGQGIRGMAWSQIHGALLVLSGPNGGNIGPFRLYRWSGTASEAPVLVRELAVPTGASAEAIVPYPGTKDVQVLFDMGDVTINGTRCKQAPPADRVFHDLIVRVD